MDDSEWTNTEEEELNRFIQETLCKTDTNNGQKSTTCQTQITDEQIYPGNSTVKEQNPNIEKELCQTINQITEKGKTDTLKANETDTHITTETASSTKQFDKKREVPRFIMQSQILREFLKRSYEFVKDKLFALYVFVRSFFFRSDGVETEL